MQKTLPGWMAELERVRNTLLLAAPDASKAEKLDWIECWQSVRSSLVTDSEIVWGNRHEVTYPPGDTQEVEEPIQQAIFGEPEVLRALLLRLNFRITLNWKPNGKKRFILDKGVLEADFTKDCKCLSTSTPVSHARRPSTSSPAA